MVIEMAHLNPLYHIGIDYDSQVLTRLGWVGFNHNRSDLYGVLGHT